MPAWEQRFNFYETSHEGARVIVFLDLAARKHAPVASHSHRLQLRVKMLQPRPDGLRSDEEFRALSALEDGLARELEANLHAIYVGRFIAGGYVDFILYVPEAKLEAARSPVVALDLGPYTAEAFIEADASWLKYAEMFPNTYAMQTITNRDLVDVMKARGDRLDVERKVEHLVRFPSEEKARAAQRALVAAGFRIDPLGWPESPGKPWVLTFHRDERCDGRNPDRFVFEVLDTVLPLDGDYDGWGSVLQTPRGN